MLVDAFLQAIASGKRNVIMYGVVGWKARIRLLQDSLPPLNQTWVWSDISSHEADFKGYPPLGIPLAVTNWTNPTKVGNVWRFGADAVFTYDSASSGSSSNTCTHACVTISPADDSSFTLLQIDETPIPFVFAADGDVHALTYLLTTANGIIP